MPNFNDEIREDNDYTEYYRFLPDDEEFFAKLIKDNWQLTGPAEIDAHPSIYSDTTMTATRENTTGGSIYVYCSTINYTQIMGIDYDSQKQTGMVSFDIQTPQWRKRNRMWAREVLRILRENRRAGREALNGWDYLEVQMINKRDQNYVNYYHTVIDVKLYRTINDIESRGRGVLNEEGGTHPSPTDPDIPQPVR